MLEVCPNEGRGMSKRFRTRSCNCHLTVQEQLSAQLLAEQFSVQVVWERHRANLIFLCQHKRVVRCQAVYPESADWDWVSFQTHDFLFAFIPVIAKAARLPLTA
jgi:hypothetical protein